MTEMLLCIILDSPIEVNMVTNDEILTQYKLKQLLNYDPDTGVFTWLIDCGPGRPNKGDIAGRIQKKRGGKSYRDISISSKRYYAHRLACLYMTGKWPDKVDHGDGDGTNNKWVNIESVTGLQNSKNIRKRSDNCSGCTGVHLHKHSGKWQVYINEKGERDNIGLYADYFEAVCARKSAENFRGFHTNHGSIRPL